MKWLVPVPFVSLCLLVSGCGTSSNVLVTDSAGSPVAGAKVQGLAFYISYPPKITDKKGRVVVRWSAEKVKWLNVSAQGFNGSVVGYKGEKQQTVVLDRPEPEGTNSDRTGDPPPAVPPPMDPQQESR